MFGNVFQGLIFTLSSLVGIEFVAGCIVLLALTFVKKICSA